MADKLLDPMENTIDDIRNRFEKYKLHCARLAQTHYEEEGKFHLEKEMGELQHGLENLRKEMESLQLRQLNLMNWQDVNSIAELPLQSHKLNTLAKSRSEHDYPASRKQRFVKLEPFEQPVKLKMHQDDQLVVGSGTTRCLFQYCQKSIDNDVLLAHYLVEHDEETGASSRCHKLSEGQYVVLSFHTKSCLFRQNHVIGLLDYAGDASEPKRQQEINLCNSLLPEGLQHLASDIPVVVFICLTASFGARKDKLLARHNLPPVNPMDQVYVIWLATPHNLKLELQAKLSLCGRDAAVQANTHLPVCHVNQGPKTGRFRPVDANYWRIPFGEMQKISNNFRDELNLAVVLSPKIKFCSGL